MTRSSHNASSSTTILLLVLLLLAFFPGLFHSLWTLPFRIIYPHSQAAPETDIDNETYSMSWSQKQISLPAKSRGSYLVTDQIVSSIPELKDYKVGMLNLFIQHTSCALSLNENFDPTVRADMSDALDRIAPEAGPKGEALYRHDDEGPDDMPAHIKSALIGASLNIPIQNGKLNLGTWQGIWYLEFRAMKHQRRIVATIQGEKMQ